jgi:hypothetical protein
MVLVRRLALARWIAPLGFLALALFRLAVTGWMPRNADDASNFLAASAMASGNWHLHGWVMAPDNYVPTEVLGMAVLIGLFGERPGLMLGFEALVWAGIALVGCRLALRGASLRHRPGILCLALAVLAFGLVAHDPGASFVSTVASHGCTILLTLLAFGLATRPGGLGAAHAAVLGALVAIGSLADPIFVVVAALPLLAVALLGLPVRTRRGGMALQGGAVAGGLVLACLLLGVNARTGGFESAHLTLILASFPALLDHLGFAARSIARLLGADFSGHLVNHVVIGGPYIALLRVPLLLAFAIALWQGGGRATRLVRGWPAIAIDAPGAALDLLLWSSAVLCIASTVMTTAIADPSCARFFLPATVCGGILVARWFGRETLPALYGAVAMPASLAFCLLTLPPSLPRAVPAEPDEQALLATLRDHDLSHGYGGYWQGSITTVLSRRAATVLALAPGPDRALVPFDWFCDRAWYRRARDWDGPVFFVTQRQPLSALDLPLDLVLHQFGDPSETIPAGRFTVVVYRRAPAPP